MTITVEKVNEIIAAAVKAEVSKDEIIVTLFTDHALSLNGATKAVAKWMKDNGMTVVRVGFTSMYHDWLVEAEPKSPRTEAQAAKFMKDNGSDNTLRHAKIFQHQRELVARAFKKGLEAK